MCQITALCSYIAGVTGRTSLLRRTPFGTEDNLCFNGKMGGTGTGKQQHKSQELASKCKRAFEKKKKIPWPGAKADDFYDPSCVVLPSEIVSCAFVYFL